MVPSGLNPIITVVGNNKVTRTYKVDTFNRRIIGTTDGEPAIEQAILKNLDTERYSYVIYSPNYGMEFIKYIGKDLDFIKADLQKTLEECLLVDNRVYAITDLEVEAIDIDKLKINFTVETLEGVLNITKEISKWTR